MSENRFFNDNKLALARARATRIAARKGAAHHGFMHAQAASILAERLAATKRTFSKPVLLFDGPFAQLIENRIAAGTDNIEGPFAKLRPIDHDNPILDMAPESADLIVSVFDCQRVHDVGALFFQVNMALKPDGLFMAAIATSGTLKELQGALMQAELEQTGGAAMRLDILPEIRQVGDLLQRTGFKLPVCDLETRLVRYGEISGLLSDLRGSGMSAAMRENLPVIDRPTRTRFSEIYLQDHTDADGRLRATVNIGFLSGWKEHESQQKPLKPGSAQKALKDFL